LSGGVNLLSTRIIAKEDAMLCEQLCILVLMSLWGGPATTVSLPYKNLEQCQIAGRVWKSSNSKHEYFCIPAPGK
jgi:hypothetical protein